jgi:sporulation protein YlmC with PRC-barrel domain
MRRTSLIALIAALGTAGPALAQDQGDSRGDAAQSDQQMQSAETGQGDGQATGDGDRMRMAEGDGAFGGEIIPLGPWHAETFRDLDGISVRYLTDSEVYGPTGDEIGEAEDVVIGEDGDVLALIAEVGGFWDIGDTHVAVPWAEVEIMADGYDYDVSLPVTEDAVDDYDLFGDRNALAAADPAAETVPGVDDDAPPPQAWRGRDLIGDYARLAGGEAGPVNYGYVSDIVVADGQVEATIVTPSAAYGGGYYAYPNYATPAWGWRPGASYYDLPYTEQDVEGQTPVEDRPAEG